MGDALALNPDKLAFIHGEDPSSEESGRAEKISIPAKSLAKAGPDVDAFARPGNPTGRRGRRPKITEPRADSVPDIQISAFSEELPPILVPFTSRLSPPVAEALRRAVLEQKLQRRKPHTQQEIVEAAVRYWLLTNGFLKAA
jgi:hypothetical protein